MTHLWQIFLIWVPTSTIQEISGCLRSLIHWLLFFFLSDKLSACDNTCLFVPLLSFQDPSNWWNSLANWLHHIQSWNLLHHFPSKKIRLQRSQHISDPWRISIIFTLSAITFLYKPLNFSASAISSEKKSSQLYRLKWLWETLCHFKSILSFSNITDTS